MKIKKIASLCKKTKLVNTIIDKNNVQWIGNGYGIYPLFGMPIMSDENLCTIFDIAEKQVDKYRFTNGQCSKICFDDNCEKENILEENDITIIVADKVLKSYQTSNGIMFIDTDYLTPFDDMAEVDIYERIGNDGKLYFAIKVGLILYGIVMPYNCINEKFITDIKLLTDQCVIAWENKQEDE